MIVAAFKEWLVGVVEIRRRPFPLEHNTLMFMAMIMVIFMSLVGAKPYLSARLAGLQ